jgi:Flp pilus assembly protein TadD
MLILVIGAMVLMTASALAQTTPAAPATKPIVTITPDMTVAQLIAQGDELRHQKFLDEAAQYYRAAIRKDKKKADAYNKLGICELQMKAYDGAQRDFTQASKLQRNFPEPLNNLGVIFYLRRDFGKAVKFYKKALALDESNPSFHSNLGTAWFEQKKFDKAAAEYARAIELDPDVLIRASAGGISAHLTSPEDRANFNYQLARMYAKRGDLERCLTCLKRAKDDGYRKLAGIYTDEEFASVRTDPRIAELIPPPAAK